MPVRMTHPRLGERHVRAEVVHKMERNGWTVADDPPRRRRRSQPDLDAKPSETDSEGFLMPDEQES